MSASIDPSRQPAFSPLWRPAGLLYLAILLAALAAGLWPDAIYPPHNHPQDAPLPVLQCVAMGQIVFFLLIYPLVLLGRAQSRQHAPTLAAMAAESAILIALTTPLYILAAFLSDATARDALRTVLCVMSLLPLAWACGRHFAQRRRAAWAVLMLLVLIVLATPCAYYIALEFARGKGAATLASISPILHIWRSSASRGASILPQQLIALSAWPIASAIWMLLTPARSKTR